jgi:alpha-beta hydrolase superfamily lysophospholipase
MTKSPRQLYFPSGGRTLFGWLHVPSGGATSDMVAVVCKPFGYEALCCHESLTTFADTCAAAGMFALRFDYTGTGDSTDGPPDADQIEQWAEDIEAAIRLLESACGARRICLIGVRLGALLAGLVASRRRVDAIVAVAPVTSGRRYLRELRAFQAGTSPGSERPLEAGPSTNAGNVEVAGFELASRTQAALRDLDLAALDPASAAPILMLDRKDLPEARKWAARLEQLGAPVTYEALPGYVEMMPSPHASQIPRDMVNALSAWIRLEVQTRGSGHPIPIQPLIPVGARMRLRGNGGVELVERATFIDGERTLFAVVTEVAGRDRSPGAGARGIILLNGGATNHIGPNRMNVELARKWAAEGHAVLRLDLAGLGDSAARPGQPRNQVYPPGAIFDIGLAIEFLRRRRGVRHVTVVGLCAGAYHALRSAVSGLPVDRLLMINPLTFYWRQGDSFSDLQISDVMRNPGVYFENIRSVRHWMKVLQGRVSLWRVAKVFVRRAWLAFESLVREGCRRVGIRLADDLGWDLRSVADRGVAMRFYFARSDAGLALLRNQGGSAVNQLGDLCRVHVIEGGDHIFTERRFRKELFELLERGLRD